MIPPRQANKWIKKMEEANKLAVKKFTDSDYIRRLEVLVRDVGWLGWERLGLGGFGYRYCGGR